MRKDNPPAHFLRDREAVIPYSPRVRRGGA